MASRFLVCVFVTTFLSQRHQHHGGHVGVLAWLTPTAQKASLLKSLDSTDFNGFLQQLEPYANMPLEGSITLPPRAYTDEQLFDLEQQTIFRPGWICVAHTAQLKCKGDYLTMDLLGEQMVIVNNGKSIEVMSRVCTHRWASICERGHGSCAKFTCPMHKWSFDLDGTCVGTPYMEEFGDTFSKDEHALHKYRSDTIGGFVYVNIDGNAEPLAPQIQGLTDWMKNWETDKTEIFFEPLEYECPFNWVSAVVHFH
jgi:phenylpropionate dioxygenase-like ring-hydroxylating dioxygenase large terminal subunit